MTTTKTRRAPVDRPGYLTSEFWLSVVAVVAAVTLCLANKVEGEAAMAAVAAATLGYGVSRGLAKKS